MNVRYRRGGGRRPPPDREVLDIASDGSFTMWRSNGSASYPPSPVGRFSGKLSVEDAGQLETLATAAAAAGDLDVTPPPDAAIERIELEGATARVGHHEEPEGPWGPLAALLRRLLGDLTAQPLAAIALEVAPGAAAARLVHRGTMPLELNLENLEVRAVLWQGYRTQGDWRAPAGRAFAGRVTAGPGLAFDLPFDHGFEVGEGREVVAYATLVALDSGQPVPVSLTSPRSAAPAGEANQ